MEVKQYLRNIRRIEDDVRAKLEQVESLKALATKVTSDISNERVQTSQTDKTADIIAKIVDLENDLNRRIDTLIDLKAEVVKRIDTVEDADLRMLLTLRYLNLYTWEKVAVEMNYSFQHVHKLHSRALAKISKTVKEAIECDSQSMV